MSNEKDNTLYNSTAFIKVQGLPSSESPSMSPTTTPNLIDKKKTWLAVILGFTIGIFLVQSLIIGFMTFKFWKGKLVGDD